MDWLNEIIGEACLDTIKLVPFLFLTYLLLELLESKAGEKTEQLIRKTGKTGPLWGGLVGLIPLCGFSSAAANFYTGNVISFGTMMAVFLATSDECLPLLISSQYPVGKIAIFLIWKGVLSIVLGFILDRVFRSTKKGYTIEEMCDDAHCECEEKGVIHSALVHTLKTSLFVLIVNILINAALYWIGEEALHTWLSTGSGLTGIALMSLIGLVPNCGISVLLTRMFLDGTISAAAMMAGLLSNAGVGLAVMARQDVRKKEVWRTIICLFASGFIGGLLTGLCKIM